MNYDDEDDRGERGERRDDYEDDDSRPSRRQEALQRVRTPGMILQVFGVISLLLGLILSMTYAFAIDTIAKPMYEGVYEPMKKQPGAKAQNIPTYEEYRQSSQIVGLIFYPIGVICSIAIVIGGGKMTKLRGYGWAMTASILAMIPCTNICACLSIPFGIWALVVLLNSDVKRAFASAAQ